MRVRNGLPFPRHRLTSGSISPVFIVGSGRSGNTLLRAILVSHPRIAIPPESYVIPRVIWNFQLGSWRNWTWIVEMVTSAFGRHPGFENWDIDLEPARSRSVALAGRDRTLDRILDCIYGHYSSAWFPEADLWGDKTPMNTFYLPWIDAVFPTARYLHMIRDGRDVVASYVNAGLQADIQTACDRWNASIQLATGFGRTNPERYMEVRYEGLVTEMATTVGRVCEFLSIEPDDRMLEHTRVARRLGDVAKFAHHSNVLKPVTRESMGRWEREFDQERAALVSRKLEKNLRLLGYI
jgi:hypothetical protein